MISSSQSLRAYLLILLWLCEGLLCKQKLMMNPSQHSEQPNISSYIWRLSTHTTRSLGHQINICMCEHIKTEPPSPSPNVFHAHEKKNEMAHMEKLREDLTLLKFSLLSISSFPPASAKETEKGRPTGRQAEKESVCLCTVRIWNI